MTQVSIKLCPNALFFTYVLDNFKLKNNKMCITWGHSPNLYNFNIILENDLSPSLGHSYFVLFTIENIKFNVFFGGLSCTNFHGQVFLLKLVTSVKIRHFDFSPSKNGYFYLISIIEKLIRLFFRCFWRHV